MNFRTSSFCESNGCVEVERGEQVVIVRNSTRPDVQVTFTIDEWRVFLQGVKADEFEI